MQRISDAPLSLEDDQRRRMRAYLIQMSVRLVCIFLAIFVPGVLRWVFIAGAVILPYTAVIFVNAGRDRRAMSSTIDPRALPARPSTSPDAPAAPPSEKTWDDGRTPPDGTAPRSAP